MRHHCLVMIGCLILKPTQNHLSSFSCSNSDPLHGCTCSDLTRSLSRLLIGCVIQPDGPRRQLLRVVCRHPPTGDCSCSRLAHRLDHASPPGLKPPDPGSHSSPVAAILLPWRPLYRSFPVPSVCFPALIRRHDTSSHGSSCSIRRPEASAVHIDRAQPSGGNGGRYVCWLPATVNLTLTFCNRLSYCSKPL